MDALKSELLKNGHSVVEREDITDRPDAALEIDGTIAACECRVFTPERLLRLHGLKMVNGELYQIFLPIEPHKWIQDAIHAKNPLIPDYRDRCKADEVWLIVHTLRGMFHDLATLTSGPLADLFHIGVWQTPHSFNRIYVVGEEVLKPICIFSDKNDNTEARQKYAQMKILRLPVHIRFVGIITATQGPDGQGMITTPSMNQPHHTIKLQPLDRAFRVDYSRVTEVNFSNIGRGNTAPIMYAEPVSVAE